MLKYEQGIGLIEVLVAVLILAVAVLGFVAMQLRAIQATNETLVRSDAMTIIRNLSEGLRHYPTATNKITYVNAINAPPRNPKSCTGNTVCNESEQIVYNAVQAVNLATESGIKIKAMQCNGANIGSTEVSKICLITSWDDTEPNMDGRTDSCAETSGVYRPGSSCIIMETY